MDLDFIECDLASSYKSSFVGDLHGNPPEPSKRMAARHARYMADLALAAPAAFPAFPAPAAFPAPSALDDELTALIGNIDPNLMMYYDLSPFVSPIKKPGEELQSDASSPLRLPVGGAGGARRLDFGGAMAMDMPGLPGLSEDLKKMFEANLVFKTNDCLLDKAGIHVIHLEAGAAWLMKTALYGAGLLGYGALMTRFVEDTCAEGLRGWDALNALLRYMREHGIPLLVCTGPSSSEKQALDQWNGTAKNKYEFKTRFESGIPLLIKSSNSVPAPNPKDKPIDMSNLLALGMPMGSPIFVPAGKLGFLCDSLRCPGQEHMSCVQFWVDLKGVGSSAYTFLHTWVHNDPSDTFRFSVDRRPTPPDSGFKKNTNQSYINLLFNQRKFYTQVFRDTPLSSLSSTLASYEAKMETYEGVPITYKNDVQPNMWWWRRAKFLKIMAEHDDLMHACVAGIIPYDIIGEPLVPMAPCMPARPFSIRSMNSLHPDLPAPHIIEHAVANLAFDVL